MSAGCNTDTQTNIINEFGAEEFWIVYFFHLSEILIFNINPYFSLLTSGEGLIFICWKKPNKFQYSLVTNYSLCFVIIGATVVKILTSQRECKMNISIKIHLPTTVKKIEYHQ